jgi:hypothetical protein
LFLLWHLTFDAPSTLPVQGYVPDVTRPNNVIAPYWAPRRLGVSGLHRVFYKTIGTTPNRAFVVEWNSVRGGAKTDTVGGDDIFKFEVILHENGDIVFQMDYAMTVAPDLAQAFRSEDDGAMTLALVRSSLETDIKVTADNYGGTYPGLIRQANGNYVYAWQKLRCVGGGCKTEAEELQFTIRDATGALVKDIQTVKDLGTPSLSTYDYSYGMASTPSGAIGIAWIEEQDQTSASWRQNVWFAVRDSNGNIVSAPQNLTKNKKWGNYSTQGVPYFFNARVAATTDNRFVVAWQREVLQSTEWSSEIFYRIFDASGNPLTAAIKFTNGKPGSGYYSPTALGIANGRVLLGFTHLAKKTQDMYFGVIQSDGTTVLASSNLSNDGSAIYQRFDVGMLYSLPLNQA